MRDVLKRKEKALFFRRWVSFGLALVLIIGSQTVFATVDTEGNPHKTPVEDFATKPAGTIPGYAFVKTRIDAEGNVVHVFAKIPAQKPGSVKPVDPDKSVKTGDHAGLLSGYLMGLSVLLFGLLFLTKKKKTSK